MHGRRPRASGKPQRAVNGSERNEAGEAGCPDGQERGRDPERFRGLRWPRQPEPGAGRAAGPRPDPDRGDRRAEPRALPRGDGRRHRLRHPRWGDPAGVRPAPGLGQGAAHPRSARAGRRPRRRGLCRRHRAGRGLHGHVRPRGHQPRDPARRCAHGLRADRGDHRPGQLGRHRHRRLPGGRHPRHHDADHQAQLPGDQCRRDPADHRRGLPHRLHRPPRPGARRHLQGRAPGPHHLLVASAHRPARLPPGDPPPRQADP